MKVNNKSNYSEYDDHRLNIKLSNGILGDRIESVQVPRDRNHHSSQIDRLMRRHLEIPPLPEFIAFTIVRMATATLSISVLLILSKNTNNYLHVLVLGLLILSVLVFLWIYCMRAIATQPQLKHGVIYLWLCIAFGAVFGIIEGNYV
ncbi:hypothetical protein B9G53_16805 [Pseudanabaena sp. SR411]|nr:hypothetical protein B9G53_16805 [Pseudanabaena sp. SR411]